ncbi:uncharacterized protein LOC110427493 [Herrania umbratica]|uniref:Uncharacterized protein LOC110427493 n=1 Tax=Herrania umbratica TaxID=108875 RepID=A0A6J1BGS2_9ROSI|nr:uncharacterized protein LOC110427493 [Herrania umbratica]
MQHNEIRKVEATDQLRFMVMLMTWLTVPLLRVLMEHFPCSLSSSPAYLPGPLSSVGSAAEPLSSSGSSMDLILHERIDDNSFILKIHHYFVCFSFIFSIINSNKNYQYTMVMANKILEDNARDDHAELLHFKRMALVSSLARTSTLQWACLFCLKKAEKEKAIDEVISGFTTMDQEVIVTDRLQDYPVSIISDWLNL